MEAIENLKSVLCDPDGKCCISGPTEDRRIVDAALEALQAEAAELESDYTDQVLRAVNAESERDAALARLAESEAQNLMARQIILEHGEGVVGASPVEPSQLTFDKMREALRDLKREVVLSDIPLDYIKSHLQKWLDNARAALEAADALEAAQAEIKVQTRAADHWMAEANKSHNLTVTQQAEIERLNGYVQKANMDVTAACVERDKALARLAEIENQEPAYLLTPDGKCYAYGSAQPLSAGHADATLLKLYAAAGASLVATPIVAWAKSTPRKLRITTMDMGREDGWRPLGYTAAGASPVEPSQARELSDDEVMRCISESACYGTVRMSFESGPYSIDKPSLNATKFASAIIAAIKAKEQPNG